MVKKPFQAFRFKITYFINDLDNYQEFAKIGAVMSYDQLLDLNENLGYFEAKFQIYNNLHYARQKGRLLVVFLFVVVVSRGPWRKTMEP